MSALRDRRAYLIGGPLVALAVGLGLEPLRGLTPSSNFTFAFIVVTIVVAELGGPVSALLTACASALSLDFFLTQPYRRLAIQDNHDVVAFVGLATCGLVAAALGSYRVRYLTRLEEAREARELLSRVLRCEGERLEQRLVRILDECRRDMPLAAAVVRDASNRVLGASGSDAAMLPVPSELLYPETLAPRSGASVLLGWRFPLPAEGGRLCIEKEGRTIGWLDLWGNGSSASGETRRALTDTARLLGEILPDGGRS